MLLSASIVPSLLSLLLISHANSLSDCLSVKSSKYCGAVGDYKVPKDVNPWLRSLFNDPKIQWPNPVADAAEFDKMFESMVLTNREEWYIRQYGRCSFKSRDRYFTTFLCGGLLFATNNPNSNSSYQCGTNSPKICRQTMLDWYDSLEAAAKDKDICPLSDEDRVKLLAALNTDRKNDLTTPWIIANENCVSGAQSESETCGWASNAVACSKNCTSSALSCGSTAGLPSSSQSSSPSDTVLIIIGICCAFAAIGLGFFIISAINRRKRLAYVLEQVKKMKEKEANLSSTTSTLPTPSSSTLNQPDSLSPKPSSALENRTATASSDSKTNKQLQTHTVFVTFDEPLHEDEIVVLKGDLIQLIRSFEDGWVHGINLRTNQAGVFPHACLFPNLSHTDTDKVDDQMEEEQNDEDDKATMASTVLTGVSSNAPTVLSRSSPYTVRKEYPPNPVIQQTDTHYDIDSLIPLHTFSDQRRDSVSSMDSTVVSCGNWRPQRTYSVVSSNLSLSAVGGKNRQ
ncbi:hypothetical protein BKA69DRAFT_1163966 [Paraphysoderma sedebokerense]|nr:hypothetical protein BKA69DRAFT_1163966 [Paraphysoderma sedebokerense]